VGTLKLHSNGQLYSNMVMVHWPLMLHLVQRGGTWADCNPAQSSRCTKRNKPPVNAIMPLHIKVQGQDVMVVEEFVSLGSLIHLSTGSTCDISRRSAITRAAMQSLENQIWRSRLAISTKLKRYNTCILPIFLYGSDC